MPKNICIYHSADWDGKLSALIVQHFVKDVVLIPYDHGDSIQDNPHWPFSEQFENIYVVDIAVDELMDDPRLIWIDHHKSEIDKYGKKKGIQDTSVSACRLCWAYFAYGAGNGERAYPLGDKIIVEGPDIGKTSIYVDPRKNYPEPDLVYHVGANDVFDHRHAYTLPLSYALDSLTMNDWGKISEHLSGKNPELFDQLLAVGSGIQKYMETRYADVAVRAAYKVIAGGVVFCCLNYPAAGSLALQNCALAKECDAAMVWSSFEGKFNVGFYHLPHTDPSLDLTNFAIERGGGGHPQACGCNRLSRENAIALGII